MDSPDSFLFRLWLLGFRTLSLGLVAMGVLATIVGTALAVLVVARHLPPSSGFSLGTSLIFVLVGVTFVLIGVRGFRIRKRRDLGADIAQTASDRDKLVRRINR
jgi:hypothetical protein